MSEPREDVLNKLDALLNKHAPSAPDIPVLTDLVDQPRIDLDVIPVLTEEVNIAAAPKPEDTPAATVQHLPPPAPPINLDLVPASTIETEPLEADAPTSVLARLEAVEAEVQAEIDARIAQTQSTPIAPPSIEIPQDAPYIPLSPALDEPRVPNIATHLPQEAAQQIATLIEADIARLIQNNLNQALAENLPSLLNNALDKALSSMLEQFMLHIEEVVRQSIADELKKQLAPFKRPAPPSKP